MEEKAVDPLALIMGAMALVFVAVALVMAAYTHLTRPEPWEPIPGTCTLPGNLVCLNHSLTKDRAKLVLGNNLGRTILFRSIAISEAEGRQRCSFSSSVRRGLPLGQGQILTLESDPCEVRGTEPGTEYNYTLEIGFSHESSQDIEAFAGEIATIVKRH